LSQIDIENSLIIKALLLEKFDRIYKDNYQHMFCVALKMINDEDAVSDIVQDIFISYFKKSQNGYEIKQPKHWLIRATINKCIDYSRYRRRFTKIESLDPVKIKAGTDEKSHDKELIKLALSKLKPKEKTLALLYGEGMTYREISEISGVKFSSVGKMLTRTLKKLKEILKSLNYEMYQ
jgi:RNA polymerase sigma-70 factor (ECF subfamily)